jgi:nuclear transport factor 2 (NTF2) superfamily protein
MVVAGRATSIAHSAPSCAPAAPATLQLSATAASGRHVVAFSPRPRGGIAVGGTGGRLPLMTESRPPFPPFDRQAALTKVQAAEDAWNTRDAHTVALAYTPDSVWRNRDKFLTGREQIVEFLTAKWERELDYVLRKSLWTFEGNRVAVRFQYECHDAAGQWYRSYGNELWEFADDGLMRRREASINDVPIEESQRRLFGPRPENERSEGHEIPLH